MNRDSRISALRTSWTPERQQASLFRTLVADPPWRFKDSLPGPKRGAASHYSVMSLDDIKQYPLPPMAPDSRLFLWRVASMQREALEVCEAWGYKPKAELIWVKTTKHGKIHMGMGRQTRNAHEACIIATRGSPERLSASVLSWFIAPLLGHSRKPDKFYSIVDSLSPGPTCELFARRSWPGWTCTGDSMGELACV